MTVSSIAAAAATTTPATAESKGVADNFDSFLQLLTTQLKNQNPLEPMDTNEFTNQLVQFSSVEQSVKTNTNLEKLLEMTASNSSTAMVGYIGKEVVADGAETRLENGTATWNYELAQPASEAAITIRDAAGRIIFNESRALPAGKSTYEWNGRDNNGVQVPAGAYAITIDTRDATGKPIKVSTGVSGTVKSVDMSGSEPLLSVDGVTVKLSSIREIRQPAIP